jgi:CDP-diacylglycerol--serine O-phosphatidyltransferase
MNGRQKLHVMPIRSLIPNMLTVLALCAGMTAIRYAISERWEAAVWAIFLAGFLDSIDGRVARLLKGTTRFGAELDSLSDVVSFGVAPAVVLYLWVMQGLHSLGWVVCLVYAVCCALRLARFNMSLGENAVVKAVSSNFFLGVPAPMGAGLVLWPMVLSFQFEDEIFRNPLWVGPYIAFVSFLLVSRIQTFSFKRVRIHPDLVLPTLILVCLFAAVLTVYPWGTISMVGVAYLCCIPFSMRAAALIRHQSAANPEKATAESNDIPV